MPSASSISTGAPRAAVIKRVSPLFTLCNSGSFAKGQIGDLLGQQLVPKLPAQSAANFSAIAAAPEPYSRSIVKILIISPSATRLPAVGLDTQKVFCVHSIRPHPGQAHQHSVVLYTAKGQINSWVCHTGVFGHLVLEVLLRISRHNQEAPMRHEL